MPKTSEPSELGDIALRVYGLVPDSIVDGPGLRYTIFVQGCTHGCPGCHNPESQPHNGGETQTLGAIYDDIKSNRLIHDVTFSGGEPFEQPDACAKLAITLKREGYGVWAYSGYLFEDLRAMSRDPKRSDAKGIADFLAHVDVLVDGPFVEAQHSYDLKWKGSANQRLIDVPASLKTGEVRLWSQDAFVVEMPPAW